MNKEVEAKKILVFPFKKMMPTKVFEHHKPRESEEGILRASERHSGAKTDRINSPTSQQVFHSTRSSVTLNKISS